MNAGGVSKACKSNAAPFNFYYMYYVYILKSINFNKLYIGFTNDLRRRLAEHNNGKSNYTSKYLPWRLVYYEAYSSKKDAQKRETAFKSHGKAWGQLKNRIQFSIKNES